MVATRKRLDVLVTNAVLVDGSGQERRRADVGVVGDRIVAVGPIDAAADVVIDARGHVVSPGFVDPHSHSDMTLHANRDAQSTVRQGVTTEIVGNCGMGNAPVSEASAPAVAARMRSHGYDGEVSWRSFGEYLADVESGGSSQNLAFLVGHSALREAAGVWNRAQPTPEQLDLMRDLVREAMEAGSLGMSTGLEYREGQFAQTEELVELAKVVGAFGGFYASHVRNRDSRILEAIDEFLTIAREGNVAGEISHLNVRHDTNAPEHAWERAVEMMADARAHGLDILADTTPFLYGLGDATGILPAWIIADGPGAAAERLKSRSVREKVRVDCDRYWRFIHKGQWDRVRLASARRFPEYGGLTFTRIGELRGQDPWDAYFDLLVAAGEEMVDLVFAGQLFTDEHMAEMISHPLFSLGVDTWSSSAHGPVSETTRDPIAYSGHVHYLEHHVRELGTLTLEEAVHKMANMPAARFGLAGRGLVRTGYYADLVVFDPETVHSASDFDNPGVYPEGIDAVVVNGVLTVDGSDHTGARAGRVLRRGA